MTLLNTTLQIVRGVFKAPGDAFSAENDLFILELQDPAGFSLQVDGWSPALPALKGGGTWAESAISDGRIPLAQSIGNVTETMRLTMGNGDLQQRFAIFKKLGQMRQSIIDFWDGTARIDPVYIRWHAAIGKGEQYALIYNLEMAQDSDIFNPEQAWDVTLTIEREGYWRGIWPGGNPKEWTLGVVRGLVRGQARYQTANMDLTSDSDHFIYQPNLPNRHEWLPDAPGDQTLPISQNYIELDGTTIPGDAPALLQLALKVEEDANPYDPIFISLSTKELSRPSHNGETKCAAYNLNAGDSVVTGGTTTAGTAANGVISNNSSTTPYYVQGTGASFSVRMDWGGISASLIKLDRELLRGEFMVFGRCHITTGTIGDVILITSIFEQEGTAPAANPSLTMPNANVPIDSSEPRLAYIGRLKLPFDSRSSVSLKGYGRQVREDSNNLYVRVTMQNQTANNLTGRFVDLILVPIDEGCVELIATAAYSGSSANTQVIYDNTGYLTRGLPEATARMFLTEVISTGSAVEIRGAPLYLIPGKRQRLYFLMAQYSSAGYPAAPNHTITVRGNVIPRWAGIRDV